MSMFFEEKYLNDKNHVIGKHECQIEIAID